jgi:hypothetical protein
LVDKQLIRARGKEGYVYLFKYKVKKDDDWKIGISGLQPVDQQEVNSSAGMVRMTDKKIKDNEPVLNQFQQQLKQVLFATRKSARHYYEKSNAWDYDED